MNKYEQLENDIIAVFIPAEVVNETQMPPFDMNPLPDMEVDYRNQGPRPRVFVSCESMEYSDSENVSQVVQEEKISVGIEIHSRNRRGDRGAFECFDLVKKGLLGLKLKGFSKFQLVKAGMLQGSGANHWLFYAQFTTDSHVTDQQPDPDFTEYVLTNPEFVTEATV